MRFRFHKEGENIEEHVHVNWAPQPKRPSWLTARNVAFAAFCLALFLCGVGVGEFHIAGCAFKPPKIECRGPDTRPQPTPPAPVPKGMQAVLCVYESSSDQAVANIWGSKEIQEYLAAKVKDKSRLIDQNADVADAPEWVKQGMGQNRKTIPCLVIQDANGQWYTADWGKDQATVLATLKKAGD